MNRKILTTAALSRQKIWKKGAKITLKINLVYNSLQSILLYNSETWGLSHIEDEKLNAFHR